VISTRDRVVGGWENEEHWEADLLRGSRRGAVEHRAGRGRWPLDLAALTARLEQIIGLGRRCVMACAVYLFVASAHPMSILVRMLMGLRSGAEHYLSLGTGKWYCPASLSGKPSALE
jgi:broad specificity phosphatase PhoE